MDAAGYAKQEIMLFHYAIALIAFILCAVCASALFADSLEPVGSLLFSGASDASGGVALNDRFIVVADDENNILRVYDINNPSKPVSTCDVSSFLNVDPDSPEADIEAAARCGNMIYWITSHGRNKRGKLRPSRYRFFATTYTITDNNVQLTPAGQYCDTLIHKLVQQPDMIRLGLDKATEFDRTDLSKKQLKKLAPKEKGLNIEGLAATPDGKSLYICFRNPRPVNPDNGKTCALVVPLLNPEDVILKGTSPRFGQPIFWNFHGLGIRSMGYSRKSKCYYIMAGAYNGQANFAFYRWDGNRSNHPVLIPLDFKVIKDFNPENILLLPESKTMLILSDDGTRLIDVTSPAQCLPDTFLPGSQCQNKHLIDPNKKTFRAVKLASRS